MIFIDHNNNKLYDPGEGLGNVRITGSGGEEVATLVGQTVFRAGTLVGFPVLSALRDAGFGQRPQPRAQHAAAAAQRPGEIVEPTEAVKGLAHDQQATDDADGLGDRPRPHVEADPLLLDPEQPHGRREDERAEGAGAEPGREETRYPVPPGEQQHGDDQPRHGVDHEGRPDDVDVAEAVEPELEVHERRHQRGHRRHDP